MSSFKRINVADAFVSPYTANKSWSIPSSSFNDDQIIVNLGINNTSSVFSPNEYITNGAYDKLMYRTVLATYYPDFLPSASVVTSSKLGTLFNDGTLTTASYFDGFINLGNLDTFKYYPTQSDSTIFAINIPRQIAGDGILPKTLNILYTSGSNGYTASLYDDGNYNLLYSGSSIGSSIGTTLTQGSYVGNVFYEQNIAILTVIPNSLYTLPSILPPPPSVTPSTTPSITPTPTPSITPSITPTPSVFIDFKAQNNIAGGVGNTTTLKNVYTLVGSVQFYTIVNGTYGLLYGQSLSGYGTTNNKIVVEITSVYGNPYKIKLYKNNIQIECVDVTGGGLYTLNNGGGFSTGDVMLITLEDGTC
jgi:hypothetical protein